MPDHREPVSTDEKVKAAEGEEITFPNPHFDMTGSGITFTIYSGLPSGSPPTGDAGLIGGGGGFVAPDPGTQVSFPAKAGGSRRAQPATVYMAVCTQQHSADAAGVDANGNWNSGVLDDCQAAFAIAAAHEHTVDRVEAITGPVGIPITGC
jgi:hypothetical protein